MDEIGKGRTAKANPILIAALEEDYAVKKFYNQPSFPDRSKHFMNWIHFPGLMLMKK
jgi:hypothetical protein